MATHRVAAEVEKGARIIEAMIFSVFQKLKRDFARFTAFNSDQITDLLET